MRFLPATLTADCYFHDVSPQGLSNIGNTYFVSAPAQVVLRAQPLCKLLAAHQDRCTNRGRPGACTVCTLAAQARALRLGVASEWCELAFAASLGSFGNIFRRGQQDANEFLECVMSSVRDQPLPDNF